LATLAIGAFAACADDPVAPSAIARFELDPAFDAAPFPGDFRRASDGSIVLGELPTRRTAEPMFDRIRSLLSKRSGFCATCNVYFPIDGELDRASVPRETEGLATDAIVLVDADEASPERGRLLPIVAEWNDALGLVSFRPRTGIALAGGRTYAAAITSSLRASDGTPLGADEGFAPLRAELVAPLVAAGVDAGRIVAATVFTTEDVTAELRRLRELELAAPVPVVTIDRVWRSGTELDELLGVPSEDRPGIDVMPAPESGGDRAIRHGSIAFVIGGRITAPRFVTGSGTDVGELRRDASGAIEAGPLEDVPFLLSIPSGVELRSLPVLVHHHGFNASRVTGMCLAETVARAGAAVLSIDAYQHGERAASARDELHAMRGDFVGADGIAETSVTDVTTRVFGIGGVPSDDVLYPGYALGAFAQFAADVVATVRFVREGELAPIRAADPALAELSFDPAVDYAGNSMGSVVGTSVLVIEPSIRRAVLNVPPGAIVENLSDSPAFRPLAFSTLLPILGIDTRGIDEIDRHMLLEPITDLFRWVIEPIDPLALAPHVLANRVDGDPAPDVLFQVAALDEVAAPRATRSLLEAIDAPRVTIYDPAGHGMLEVRGSESAFEPPYDPPLVPRMEPIPVANPIDAVHDEIAAFLAR
jgi:hypothetical protein